MTELSASHSFNTGSDLWIIPSLSKAKAAMRMDWYLNFQISRIKEHKKNQISFELRNILSSCDLELVKFDNVESNKVMFVASHALPNRWLVMVPDLPDFVDWVREISSIWADLHKPSLRIFLPTGLSSGEFKKLWSKFQSFDDFTIVVD